ncbi:MAG: 6-carboxytetrahydropterin synthase [Dehalococcoidia bacterium]|jgi:6-pyruvoyltetrahydropterin/6-carboxytetrahydropterin synthase|nr:6-carboxytetrahydropterin synthase [Dehalococcoidia bacterium]MDW8008738.1 6-carboxytetrahydropterin synthase [Chloroflexota bacterium]
MLHNGHSANQSPYRIVVSRGALGFAAAHFATFAGQAEPLHGHNYAVSVEVEGDLTADAWVLDFGELKAVAAALCRRLDHRFILPTRNPRLQVRETHDGYEVRFGQRLYLFPGEDVVALPVENSTAECLARYLAEEMARELQARGHVHLRMLRVEVEEGPGQSASYTMCLQEG